MHTETEIEGLIDIEEGADWAPEKATRPPFKSRKEKGLRINYQVIVRNLPFILYLSLLALFYIANGHFADKNIREINTTSHEIQDLRWEYLNVKSDLMFRSKMSEVSRSVAPMGLKELDAPAITLIIAKPAIKK
jgi:hypothetical protein